MGDFTHFLQIFGDVGNNVAGLGIVVIGKGQLLQVIKRLAARIRLNADAQRMPQ